MSKNILSCCIHIQSYSSGMCPTVCVFFRDDDGRLLMIVKSRHCLPETADAYQLKADLPGVQKEDVSLEVDGNIIRIGAKQQESEATEEDSPARRCARYSFLILHSAQKHLQQMSQLTCVSHHLSTKV